MNHKMTINLDDELLKIKNYVKEQDIKKLIKKTYSLDFTDEYLGSLSQDELLLVHVKLHNALSYKKPFASIKNIKKVHDKLIGLLENHHIIDQLDV